MTASGETLIEQPTAPAAQREVQLVAWMRSAHSVAIGYSGGVDSTYLASVAVSAVGPANALAIIGVSASYPEEQWKTARAAASAIGIEVLEVFPEARRVPETTRGLH